MKKKILNLSLIAAIFIQPVMINADVMSTAMSNVTGPARSTITDSSGRQVGNKMYTGGFAYRFGSSTPPPLFNISPPSIEASCSGLNLKGMFVSLLNLDQLGAMLQDAGASLAWGVAIGLIYSLPGVASAFKMINEWATKLQQLLASACQMGQNLGMNLAKQFGPDKNEMETTIVSAIETPAKALQDGVTGFASYLGSKIPAGTKSLFDSPETLSPAKKADAMGGLLAKSFTSDVSMGGAIMSGFLKYAPIYVNALSSSTNDFQVSNVAIVDDSSSGDLPCQDSGSIVCSTLTLSQIKSKSMSLTAGQKMEQALFAYAIIYNYTFDVGYEETSVSSFIDKFESMSKMGKGTETPVENSKATEAITKTQNVAGFKFTSVGTNSKGSYEEQSSILASILLYGLAPSLNEPAYKADQRSEFITSFKAPVISIATLREKESAINSIQPFVYGIKSNTQFFGTNPNFKGTYNSSGCIIKGLIKNPNSNPVDENGQACTSIPIIINNLHSYLKIITNTPLDDRDNLIKLLIEYNAYYATSTMIDGIIANINISSSGSEKIVPNNTGATPSNTTTQNKDEVTGAVWNDSARIAQNDFLTALKVAVNKELSGKDIPSVTALNEAFDIQDKKNRERALPKSSNK